MTSNKKWVYSFGDGKAEGEGTMRNLLGGKGANLAEMCFIGLPVPGGITITTEVCTAYYENNRKYPTNLEDQVQAGIAHIEKLISKNFGDAANPLLVSVRSGARASMPGMMDTILNLGLNDKTVEGLAKNSGDARFAYDSYRRFIQMYSGVVLGVDHYTFEEIIENKKLDKGITNDTSLTADDWKDVVVQYKKAVEAESGEPFPQDVKQQLWGAIGAVFNSWMNDRAITYRKMYDIPESWGTAVTVQAMVFGNMGEDCATGVAFTRDPSTGEKLFYGEYLINAQGEDVVAGIRTPQQVTIEGKNRQNSDLPAMEESLPVVYAQLVETYKKLENHYRDMQDIEFTVETGKLWMLQTRNGKRTTKAALKIAVDMVHEGLITKEEGLLRIRPEDLDQLLHPTIDPKAEKNVIAKGLPASPGAASGAVFFSANEAEEQAAKGKDVILVRIETSPEDIHGMAAARGILTARGGMTSHAAVVARGMGRACVSGAGGVSINYKEKKFNCNGLEVKEGDIITINGSTGEVMLGRIKTIDPELSTDFEEVMKWADELRTLKIRTNAETPADSIVARRFGAEGIGLCRTEHMFFDAERIIAMREMIVANTLEGRKKAINKLLPYQRADFEEIFKIMNGFPVTIRLLDPPLHEFLPHTDAEYDAVAKASGVAVENVKKRAHELHEQNPMLGHRGCRLGITYPELYEMQARAIFEAACAQQQAGIKVIPEIMIPLVMTATELKILKDLVVATAEKVFAETSIKVEYLVGTMIELPRAALQAAKIAEHAQFFSFGTNDLTQTTLGISRDDSANFIGQYIDKGIFEKDPFATLDVDGVGELIQIATERGRKTRPDIKLGICGEHGGNPASIEFCHKTGLDYVSCSPFRVPIARLAAAHAAINNKTAGSVKDTAKKAKAA
jgi:pyruvate, orthophosphate dikinase